MQTHNRGTTRRTYRIFSGTQPNVIGSKADEILRLLTVAARELGLVKVLAKTQIQRK